MASNKSHLWPQDPLVYTRGPTAIPLKKTKKNSKSSSQHQFQTCDVLRAMNGVVHSCISDLEPTRSQSQSLFGSFFLISEHCWRLCSFQCIHLTIIATNYIYIYICIHIFTYAIIYYFPSPQYIPWRFIILTRRLDSSLAWELWVWRCYRFLVAIFIPRWVRMAWRKKSHDLLVFSRVTMENLRVFLAKKHLVLVKFWKNNIHRLNGRVTMVFVGLSR